MNPLAKEILNNLDEKSINRLANSIGSTDKNLVNSAAKLAVPLILGKLGANSKDSSSAEKLFDAVVKDHSNKRSSKSVFDAISVDSILDGNKILGHVFGTQKEKIEAAVSKKTGLDEKTTKQVFELLAPVILDSLGEKINKKEVSKDNISDFLNKKDSKNGSRSFIANLAFNLLDKDDDGEILDDLLRVVKN